VPITYADRNKKLTRIRLDLRFTGSSVNNGAYVNEIGFAPVAVGETYVNNEIPFGQISQIKVDAEWRALNNRIDTADYFTEDDIASTAALFRGSYSKDIICENGTKRKAGVFQLEFVKDDGTSVKLNTSLPYCVKTVMPQTDNVACAYYSYGNDALTVRTEYVTDNVASKTVTVLDYKGNVLKETDEYGVSKEYKYEQGNLTRVTLTDSNGVVSGVNSYFYEEGKLIGTADGLTGSKIRYDGDLLSSVAETKYNVSTDTYFEQPHSVSNVYDAFKEKAVSVTERYGEKQSTNGITYFNGSVRTVTDGRVKYGIKTDHVNDEVTYTCFDGETESAVQTDKITEEGTNRKYMSKYFNGSEESAVTTVADKYGRTLSVSQDGETSQFDYEEVAESELTAEVVKATHSGEITTYERDGYGNLTGYVKGDGFEVKKLSESAVKYSYADGNEIISAVEYDGAKIANPRVTAVRHYSDVNEEYDAPTELRVLDTSYAYDTLGRVDTKSTHNNGKYRYWYLDGAPYTVSKVEYKNYGDDANNDGKDIRYVKNKSYVGKDVTKVEEKSVWTRQYNALQYEEVTVERNVSYALDSLHRIVQERKVREYEDYDEEITRSYAYDASGRIASVKERKVQLDGNGDEDESTEEIQEYLYSYDNFGRLIQVGDALYSYDNYGNRTLRSKDGTRVRYEYSSGNRLIRAGNAAYRYGAQGERIRKEVDGKVTEYYTDGNKILGERTEGRVRKYVYDLNGLVGYMDRTGAHRYVLDEEGSVVMILNAQGTEVQAFYTYDTYGRCAVYDGWGKEDKDKGSIGNTNPIRWKSFYYDTETGLYYTEGRYYDCETGMYLDASPISTIFDNAYFPRNLDRNMAVCNNILELSSNPYNVFEVSNMSPDPNYKSSNATRPWWFWVIGGVAAVVSFAATVFLCGVPIAIASTLIGASVGAAYGVLTAHYKQQDLTTGALSGALSGIFMSNLSAIGAATATGNLVERFKVIIHKSKFFGSLMAILGGAAAGAYNEISNQYMNYGTVINGAEVALSALSYGISNLFSMYLTAISESSSGLWYNITLAYYYNIIAGMISGIVDLIK
ncbi:MAG: hypothetical protein NC132_06960, partial [Corallococcus sp.]|nr:hypothetical protein [Corallococcus sp.]